MNIIFSKVPTQYQYQSIHRLMGMAPTKEGSVFVVRIPIEGVEEAREWMTKRNEYLYANDYLSESEYQENKESILYDSPVMGYDAATCGVYEDNESLTDEPGSDTVTPSDLRLTDAVAEIFYEIVSHMETELRTGNGKLTQQYDAEGSKLLWSYAKSWTEEFVRENPDSTSWDGNFIDNVEAFVQQKIENLQ